MHVTSHTADPTALTGYGPLSDPAGRRFTLRWMGEGIVEISEIVEGKPIRIRDRTAAERLTNTKLFIERDRLPAPEPDEYYLADLIGLAAVGVSGAPLGVVSAVHDYGAGVSLEVTRENADSLLIPFTAEYVPEVDTGAGRVTVVPPDETDVPKTASPGQGPTSSGLDTAVAPQNLVTPDRVPASQCHGHARSGHQQRCHMAADFPIEPGTDEHTAEHDGYSGNGGDPARSAVGEDPAKAEVIA